MAVDSNVTLRSAATQYAATLPSENRSAEQPAIDGFVRWCGRDRSTEDLTPQVIEQYGAWVANEGSDPTSKLVPVRSFLTYLRKKKIVQLSLATHLRVPRSRRTNASGGKGAGSEVALSAEGRANLQARLEILQEERISVVADIQRAMADKDFRENAPLDAAKERQGKIEADIRELEHTLARAVLRRDGEVSATVRLGNTVRLKEISTGKVMQYRLVDAAEADPSAGKLSSSSPVGRALLQKAVGEEVSVSAPRGTMIYKIEEVAV